MPETSQPPESLPRDDHLAFLRRLHEELKPRTYMEIGTQGGASLSLARCASLAVDPYFQITSDIIGVKPSCLLFRMTSDAFFRAYNPIDLLGAPIDLGFIDGKHLFEFALRDFINMEQHAQANSVIAIHDILPADLRMAERAPYFGEAWTGDVWKLVLALKKYRPDIKVHVIASPPAGVALCTSMNPKSRSLSERYFDLVEEFGALELKTYTIAQYRQDVSVREVDILESSQAIARYFWL